MDGLQFGGHHQLATHDAWLIWKALPIPSLDAGFLSLFVGHDTLGPGSSGDVWKGPVCRSTTSASCIPSRAETLGGIHGNK